MSEYYEDASDKWQKIVAKEGVWADHPDYLVEFWVYEVRHNETRQGYIQWVHSRIEDEYDE